MGPAFGRRLAPKEVQVLILRIICYAGKKNSVGKIKVEDLEMGRLARITQTGPIESHKSFKVDTRF